MALQPSSAAMAFGLVLFFLAGFQALRYRDYLSLTQQEFESVPLYITIETIVAFSLCLWGLLQTGSLGMAGQFKPSDPYANQRGLDATSFRPDFMSFNHRGHLIPSAAQGLQ